MTGRFVRRAVLVGLAVLATNSGCGTLTAEKVQVGTRIPPFSLTAQDGQVVDSASLKGQVVLLNFWSTTCGPCVREMPHLQHVNDAGLAKVVAVALDPEGWQTVRPFLAKHQIRFPVAIGTEELFQRFDGVGTPHAVLIDKEQRVVRVYRGAVTRERLVKDLAAVNAD